MKCDCKYNDAIEKYRGALEEIKGTFVTYPFWKKLNIFSQYRQLKLHADAENNMREVASTALDFGEQIIGEDSGDKYRVGGHIFQWDSVHHRFVTWLKAHEDLPGKDRIARFPRYTRGAMKKLLEEGLAKKV